MDDHAIFALAIMPIVATVAYAAMRLHARGADHLGKREPAK